MLNPDHTYDVIVIGSGPAGSTAVKELTGRGLDVLLLEAGRELREEDFEPLKKKPAAMGMDLVPRAKAMARGQFRQACRPYFSESSNRFLVNDVEDPYTTPLAHPYLWVRSKLLGGRMNSYGNVLQRMSDVEFKAASQDGYGEDWPISYDDLEPWYDRVEEFLGVYGDRDGLTHPPDGHYAGPGFLTGLEKDFKSTVEARWPERKVISWRVQAPFLDRVPPGIAAGRLTIRTDAEVTRITTSEATGLATGAVFPVPAGSPAPFGLGGSGEMLARHDNVVALSSRLKDRWGMPVPHIDVTMGHNDRILLKRTMTALKEMAGECGGARMGTDPRTSIMNGVNQLWDVPTVFVPDASSFVSSSTVGPALTIMALAARTSAFVADRLADGDLRETAAYATV